MNKLFKPNVIYAVKRTYHRRWERATLKFIRHEDNVPVMQLLDFKGLRNFDSTLQVRKITDQACLMAKPAFLKLFVYGVGIADLDFGEEFLLIFSQLVKDKETLTVMSLLEEKSNMVHDCYAGDFLWQSQGALRSFREVLIREGIVYPNHTERQLNARLFLESNRNKFYFYVEILISRNY